MPSREIGLGNLLVIVIFCDLFFNLLALVCVDKDNLVQELIKLFVELFFVLLALALCEYDGLLKFWKAEFSVVVHISGPHEARPQSHLSNSKKNFKAYAQKKKVIV